MKVKEINDFQSVKDYWNHLLKKNVLGDNVFLTLEWLSIWWKHFGEGREPLLLTVEDKNEIIAVAPLMLSKYKLPIFGSIRKVEFIGVKHADYNDFIILRNETKCIRLILDYLLDVVEDWDWIELKDIPEWEIAHYPHILFLNIPSKLKLNKRVCNICPYITLPTSFEIMLKNLSKKMRKNLKTRLRKIKSDHRIEFKKYDEAGFSVAEAMKLFIKLHGARWAAKGTSGVFNDSRFRDFHFEIAENFARRKWLGLYFLLADDEPVSAEYTFEYGNKIYDYLCGFDPRFSQYSVGNLTIFFLLERSIQNGFKEYDMMRGDEPYKRLWTKSYRKNIEIRLVRKNILCEIYNWLTWSSITEPLGRKFRFSLKMIDARNA